MSTIDVVNDGRRFPADGQAEPAPAPETPPIGDKDGGK